MEIKMIEVRGYIDDLLTSKEYKGVFANIGDQEEFLMTMFYAPIIQNGKPIGVVNNIDFEDRTWSGVIWADSIIEIDPCNISIQSVRLIKGGT